MSRPLVSLRQVGVRYGNVAALEAVDLDVAGGEFLALIGSNGSGKTSLLHALHGLVPLSGQRVLSDPRMGQAMVFQRPFMMRLSVWNNLRLGLWLAGVSAQDRPVRALDALQRAGLADLRNRPARALSGGQQQRLALARAWATRPAILFLDEPTANLDPTAKKAVESMLARFHADGMTLVMSTHNLGQAKRLATRVVYLDAGRISADLPTVRFFSEHFDGRAELFLKGDLR